MAHGMAWKSFQKIRIRGTCLNMQKSSKERKRKERANTWLLMEQNSFKSFSDGSCWEIIIIKQIHTFTSNILFEQRRFGLGCPRLYQVKWTRRCSNNMLLVNVWICLMSFKWFSGFLQSYCLNSNLSLSTSMQFGARNSPAGAEGEKTIQNSSIHWQQFSLIW